MTKPNSYKRRLLRAAVQDNINTIQDHWPRLLLQDRPCRPGWLSRSVVFLVFFAVSSLFYVVITGPKNQRKDAQEASPIATVTATNTPLHVIATATTMAPSVTLLPTSSEMQDLSSADTNEVKTETLAASNMLLPETLLPEPRQMNLNAFALPVKTIVIDPGHGGDDPGAVTPLGLTEKEIALDIGLRLRAFLMESSFTVHMTREKDETVSLGRRAAFANAAGGDLFISIHINWVEPRQARVVETYYLGSTENAAALQLASAENHQSGYSLVDFHQLLEGVYTSVKRGESRKLAEAVQGELVRSLRTVNPTLSHKAAKTAPFIVLVGANMPAILTEVSCLSNDEEAQLLTSPEYRQQIAQALFVGVRSYTDALYRTYATRKEAPS
jgi:N-acetylmuramoyl-L-alanine amidase